MGDRQHARERNSNVIDVECEQVFIAQAIERTQAMDRKEIENIYGKPDTDSRIARELAELEISVNLLKKLNAY